MRLVQRVEGARIINGTVTILLLLMTNMVCSVKGDTFQAIDGTVADAETNELLSDIEIAFTNERTLETIYDITDDNGYFYINLNDFIQGWQYGDIINLLVLPTGGYAQYFTSIIIPDDWSIAITIDIRLVYDIYNENVIYPWIDYTTQWQLNCINNDASLNPDIVWAHIDNCIIHIPDADPDYDGVEIQGGLRIEDDGDWVTPGQTWKVYAQYYMKINRYFEPNYVYYEKTLELFYQGYNYYQITSDSYVLIDPMHDVKIEKNDINNHRIQITAILYWQWYFGDQQLGSDFWTESQTMKYCWD